MEIRVQDPAVPGDLKAEGTAEGKMSEKAGLDLAAEALKVNEKIISGEIMLNEVVAQTQSLKEEAKNSDSEKTEKSEKSRPARDTASVSDSPEVWDEEEWKEAFREFADWRPSENLSFPEELDQLAKVYKELLLAVLTHGTQEGGETGRLNQELSLLLQKLLMARLGDLELLLKNYGSPISITALRGAVCRSVMGKNLTQAELNQIFGSGDLAGKPGTVIESGIRTPVSDKENETGMGIIYQPAGSGTIKNNQGYAESLMRETSMIILEKGASIKGKAGKTPGASLTISPLKTGRVYEIKDLETAQRFAAYMNREGNLFKLAGLTGKSEELWGFLAALMSIKSQVFVSYLGMEKGLAMDLREAGDRMIDELIQEMVSQSLLKYSGASVRNHVFEAKDVYKIFYYMMNIYQAKADVNEAANKGIRYAYQQFLKKKEVSENRREPESFFTKEKKIPAEDFKEGRKLIERDWREFLNFLSSGNSSEMPQGILMLSPWGMLAEPETVMERDEGNIRPAFILGGGAALVILIIIVSFIWF
ncbi:hypothetical protein LAD12857_32290 [Lacrimispora amygdalina]|uniref:Uncharacterized protein n=1 Tax=Lacrimispora amygdalina TaxID=253257 RepID=A0ABQ5M9Q2_9FIRM